MLKNLLLALTIFGVLASHANAATRLDGVAAVVNKDVILVSELEKQAEVTIRRLSNDGRQLPPKDVLHKQILESLIVRQLQLQEADRTGIKITDEELNESLAETAGRSQMSLDQWRAAVERVGEDYETLREFRRQDLAIQQVRTRALREQVQVTAEEVALFLANPTQKKNQKVDYRLAHILIALNENPSSDAVKKAKEKAMLIVDKARSGADFGELAQIYSDSPQALDGGDLGWRKGNELPTIFEQPVLSMEVGGVSDPIRNRSGFHIISLMEKRAADRVTVAETKVNHILIRTNNVTNDSDAKAKLARIRQSIIDGADFGEMAIAHSEDPGSAARGGSLGYVTADAVVPQFAEVYQSAKIGEVTEPFRSPFGWHILQVEDRRETDRTEELRENEARALIQQRKFEEAVELWRQKLLDEAYVDIRL